MATTHYWRAVLHAHGGDQEKLKEVVVKDAEIVGILGALVLTITVAGLAIVDAKLADSSLVRTVYVALAFCSFVFSLISLMISSRLLLSINRLPAKDALACLEELDRAGAAHAYWWFSRSLLFLLFAVLISVYLLYDALCFAICSIFTFLPLWMMYHLHRVHVGVVWPMMNFSPLAADSHDDTSDSADPGETLPKSSRTRLKGQAVLLEEQRIEDAATMMEVMETSEELDEAKSQEEVDEIRARNNSKAFSGPPPKVTQRVFFDVAIAGKQTGRMLRLDMVP
ncbi:hscB [Symbiodinium sp. CCMP2456]|nr:hscB [Symbiodinium sp. CCMP2456]